MAIAIVCPSCEKKLNVPENAAGTRVMCTKCGEIIPVPRSAGRRSKLEEEGVAAYAREDAPASSLRKMLRDLKAGLTQPQGLGICGLCLAMASICLMCVLALSLSLSGLAMLLGVIGLLLALYRRDKKAMTFPLGAMAAGILALILALLPNLHK
jgi:hypothetical protein